MSREIEERLMKYCMIDTQSDENSLTSPSTAKQFDLANMLVEDLKEAGIEDAAVDEYCYVYGHLKANTDIARKRVGFVSHMDTSPDYNGKGVKPRIIRDYDGKDITLAPGVVMRVGSFPRLAALKGKTLMVTDGSTLLGADDKAGITAIIEALGYFKEHPEVKHGDISIAFTPDEEIGRGTEHFDYERFNADFAYTMDGSDIRYVDDETFNAASALVSCTGFSIHPGFAKDRMINALNVASAFHELLPAKMRPEHTELREGFYHLTGIEGTPEHAVMKYIIRDHDRDKFEAMLSKMKENAAAINARYDHEVIKVEIQLSYRNMKEILDEVPEVMNIAAGALEDLGIEVRNQAVRGGTDGAQLSYHGLPCPNIGTGGRNFHGRYEYCVMEETELAVKVIVRIAERVLQEKI